MRDKMIGRTLRRGSELPLFTMKVATISWLPLLLAVLLASCTVAQASPTGFLFTDMSHLAFLRWNESVQGKVAGQEDMQSAPASLSSTALPLASTMRFLGTFEDGQLSLRAGSVLLGGRLTGERLQLQRSSATNGVARQTWFAASPQQYHSLVAAFTVSLQLQGALNALSHLLAHPPSHSNPISLQLAVQQVRQYVSTLESALTAIRTAPSTRDRCDQVNTVVQAGRQAYRSLQIAYQKDEQAMAEQEHEYQQIGQQVQPFQQGC